MAIRPRQQVLAISWVGGRVKASVKASQLADDARVLSVNDGSVDEGGILVHLFTRSWKRFFGYGF